MNTHPGNHGVEHPFISALIMRYIGRCAAHVKCDDLVKTGLISGFNSANNAASRAGQNRILALKQTRISQPAIGLHHL